MTWGVYETPGGVHVVPEADTVPHDLDDDCVCGPATEPVPGDDGSMGWLITHDALDGRELRERGEPMPREAA